MPSHINVSIENNGAGELQIQASDAQSNANGGVDIQVITRIVKADIYAEAAKGEGVARILQEGDHRR